MSVFQIFVLPITHAVFITIFNDFLYSYNSPIPVATKFFNNHGSTWSTHLTLCSKSVASITFIYK